MLNLQSKKLLLLLFLSIICDAKRYKCNQTLSCGCSSSNVEINARIINGEEAIPYSWSMIVSLRYDFLNNGDFAKHACGGTILSDSYILTTATCLDGITDFENLPYITIAAGIHRRSQPRQIIRDIDRIIIHPNWTLSGAEAHHDIALLHLAEPLDFELSSLISRTCLSSQLNTEEELIQYPAHDTTLFVVGWGRLSPHGDESDILRQITVYSIDYNDTACTHLINDTKSQFCAGIYQSNTGPCYGDFGGPLFQWKYDHWEQVGITSFSKDSCERGSPIVYTRVAYYRKWIDTHIYNESSTTVVTSSPTTITPMSTTEAPPSIYYCDNHAVPCGCGRRNVQFTSSKSIYTSEAIHYSWSMIVSIRSNGTNKHSCSGTILTESYILTSASCVADVSSFGITIAAGIHNRLDDEATYRKVDSIFLHPDYTGILDNFANDIAILHISQPLNIDNDLLISRTCLTEIDESLPDVIYYPLAGTRLAMIGWGYTNFDNGAGLDILQQAEVYASVDLNRNCNVMNTHRDIKFCAETEDGGQVPCNGDSGSPIFRWTGDRWQQVGLASSPRSYVESRTCGIYTRLVSYYNWIQSIIDTCSISSSTTITTTTITTATATTPFKSSIIYQCNKTSSCGCGAIPVVLTPTRIVGGENAIDYSWPMVVSIRWLDAKQHWCGGTILSNSYILTAAHCLAGYISNPPIDVTIAAGVTNRSDPRQIRRSVDRVYIYPNYTGVKDGFRHDIALMHVNQSFTADENPFLTKTCIHRVDPPVLNNQYIKNGTNLVVIGWGTNIYGASYSPEILQQVEVYAIDNQHPVCAASMNDSETQFCAGLLEGGKDACQGDSGGPIFQYTGQYWEQIGVVSYGNGCAAPGNPGVYTRLSYYYKWIKDILENENEHLEPEFPPYIPLVEPNITGTTKINPTITFDIFINITSTIPAISNSTASTGNETFTNIASNTAKMTVSSTKMTITTTITTTTSTMTSNGYNHQRNTHIFATLFLLITKIIFLFIV